MVRLVPESDAWTAGLPQSVPAFFSRSHAWRELDGDEARDAGRDPEIATAALARYAPTRVLLSGWIRSPETIAGRAAWVRARYGAGEVVLMGFEPQYRSWSQATFHLLFRSLFLE